TFLNNIERKTKFLPDKPEYHVNWTYHLGKIAVNVPYTLSLMPLGEGKTLFLIKLNYKPGLIKVSQTKFRVDEAFMLAEWIDEALGQFNFEGDPTPLDVPIPALSLLAIPKIAELFDYQGEEIEWPADISGFSPSDPISTPKPKGDPLPKADPVQEPHKFCTACGEKLKSEAAFCSKCGTKQD
ncbi:MAG: zinc ribbon domain-containing protein, partial [Anaerolineaceae bacterium]|nr:zinc ribbon domain-containing protein [Anaerolineaceae bacterium]